MDSPDILNDPMIKLAAMARNHQAEMRGRLAEQLMSVKTWDDMNDKERKLCVGHLVTQASSEEELRKLLSEELGLDFFEIEWHESAEGDKTGEEAKLLIQALGGDLSKNGAMVNIMTMEGLF